MLLPEFKKQANRYARYKPHSVKQEALIFDWLRGDLLLREMEAGVKALSPHGGQRYYGMLSQVVRFWFERGLIHAGRLEADIKKRLEEELAADAKKAQKEKPDA